MRLRRLAVNRPALTLIELLVVITLMAVLATLTVVYVLPAFQDNKSTQRGADRLAGALLIAKQRALRDQLPRGLRLVPDGTPPSSTMPANATLVRQLQYIEQPDPFNDGVCSCTFPSGTTPTTLTVNFTFRPGTDTGVNFPTLVQNGDFLRVPGLTGNNQVMVITSVAAGASNNTATATVVAPAAPVVWPNQPYFIYRQPRPITGEPLVDLPSGVVIYVPPQPATGSLLQGSTQGGVALKPSSGPYDILFSPSGGVIAGANLNYGSPIILWVATEDSVNNSTPDPSSVQLIVIQTGTGFIGNQPINMGAGGFYKFALEGRASGM